MCLEVFLGSRLPSAIGSPRRDHRTVAPRLCRRICLPASAPNRFNALFRQRAGVPLLRHPVAPETGGRIFTALPSGFASRLALRSRLTLIRLALIRNPWPFGGRVSRPPYRYLFLHLLFRCLQCRSRDAFCGLRNAPLPTRLLPDPTASAAALCPLIIHAGPLD